jgi:DmsE family decaheme c-type cytochrome
VVTEFRGNPHARGQVTNNTVGNDVCTTCHGDATAHIESGGDKDKIVVPRGRTGSDETCMLCHDVSTNRSSHRTGVHANSATVNCLSCHSVHHAEEPQYLVRQRQPALCSSCHGAQSTSLVTKPYTHRIGHGGMKCSTCHEPHGRAGRETLRTTAANENPCMSCHADKRGPHVFQHGASTVASRQDSARACMTCHEPHGSTNPKQLRRATVRQLCMECHSATAVSLLGSQPPGFHNLNDPRYQQCTTCHVAVHGSNRSPSLLK